MHKISWKMTGLAAAVAAGAQLATMGAASALVLPVPGQATVGETGQSNGQLLRVDYNENSHFKNKHYRNQTQHRRYDRRHHGQRYRNRRHGYGYHYGGYWYASPWWLVSAPTVVVPVPFIEIR